MSSTTVPSTHSYSLNRRAQAVSPLRSSKLFYFGLALIFVRFSMIHQIMAQVIGTSFYMMYWIGVPTILGLLISRAFQSVLSHRPARYWFLFGLWVALAVPFSFWPGGSFTILSVYWRVELLMLFAIAGIVTSWRECRLILLAIALATFVNLISSRFFGHADPNDRMSFALSTSAVANPNDFAGHLIFVLPFVLWLAMSTRYILVRLFSCLALAYGLYLILASGSRGAAVALIAQILFLLFYSPSKRRLLIWLLAALFVALAIAFLPTPTWNRIQSIFINRGAPEEAVESRDSRQYLLRKSIAYTFQHPLLGVGPGQFGNYEGTESRLERRRGSWHETHNSYTEASSECGIPGGLFFLLGVFSTFSLLKRAWRRALDEGRPKEIINAIFCLRLSFAGFCTAVFFLNFAYYFYLPAMAGLAIALWIALEQDNSQETGKKTLVPSWVPKRASGWRSPAQYVTASRA